MNKHSLLLFILVVIIGSLGVSCSEDAQPSPSGQRVIAQLDASIPELMAKARIPGLSIALIEDGKLVWKKGYGVKNVAAGGSVDENTVFEAASLTKPFFAYLVIKMAEQGEIDLDRPLHLYVPRDTVERLLGHPLDQPGFRLEWFNMITARHVLSHTAGTAHGGRGVPYPLLFEPGRQFSYSADGYYYLQKVVEYLKDEPLEEIMNDRVIGPLGMTHSSLVWKEEYETTSAVGHNMLGIPSEPRKYMHAHSAASLYTTAGDYAKFVIAVLREYASGDAAIREMLTPEIAVADNVTWSLGFGIEQLPAKGEAFFQWGDYGIFRNYITAIKGTGNGVVYLTNSFYGLGIGQEIVQKALDVREDFGLTWLGYFDYDSEFAHLLHSLSGDSIDDIVKRYREIRARDPEALTEGMMNSLGYELLGAAQIEKAIAILKLNVEAHPRSANVYDSLGEAYEQNGDLALAAEYYQRALNALPDDPTRSEVQKNQLRTAVLEHIARVKAAR